MRIALKDGAHAFIGDAKHHTSHDACQVVPLRQSSTPGSQTPSESCTDSSMMMQADIFFTPLVAGP